MVSLPTTKNLYKVKYSLGMNAWIDEANLKKKERLENIGSFSNVLSLTELLLNPGITWIYALGQYSFFSFL